AGEVRRPRALPPRSRWDPTTRRAPGACQLSDTGAVKLDLTVLAVPAYFAAIGAEYAWQRAHPVAPGTRAGDYQRADTLASLAMGTGSLVAPYLARKVLNPVTPGKGKYGRALLAAGATAALLTTVGDVVRRRVR